MSESASEPFLVKQSLVPLVVLFIFPFLLSHYASCDDIGRESLTVGPAEIDDYYSDRAILVEFDTDTPTSQISKFEAKLGQNVDGTITDPTIRKYPDVTNISVDSDYDYTVKEYRTNGTSDEEAHPNTITTDKTSEEVEVDIRDNNVWSNSHHLDLEDEARFLDTSGYDGSTVNADQYDDNREQMYQFDPVTTTFNRIKVWAYGYRTDSAVPDLTISVKLHCTAGYTYLGNVLYNPSFDTSGTDKAKMRFPVGQAQAAWRCVGFENPNTGSCTSSNSDYIVAGFKTGTMGSGHEVHIDALYLQVFNVPVNASGEEVAEGIGESETVEACRPNKTLKGNGGWFPNDYEYINDAISKPNIPNETDEITTQAINSEQEYRVRYTGSTISKMSIFIYGNDSENSANVNQEEENLDVYISGLVDGTGEARTLKRGFKVPKVVGWKDYEVENAKGLVVKSKQGYFSIKVKSKAKRSNSKINMKIAVLYVAITP